MEPVLMPPAEVLLAEIVPATQTDPLPPEPEVLYAEVAADSERPVIDGASAEFAFVTTSDSPERRYLPEPTLVGAVGAIIGWLFLTGFLTVVLATAFALVSNSQQEEHYILLGMAASSLAAAVITWQSLQPVAKKYLAMVRPRWQHLVMACLLPIPLQILFLSGESAYYRLAAPNPAATATTEAALAHATQVASAAAHPAKNWQTRIFEQYEILARQSWFIVILIGCVLPAVGEEMFFRGLIGRGLLAHLGLYGGVLVTSLFFGLVHLEPSQILFTGLMGIVLHMLYLCSKSIWVPMLMHFVNNVLAFGLLKWMLEGKLPQINAGAIEIPWYLSLASAVSLAAMLLFVYRTRASWRDASDDAWEFGYVTAEAPVSAEATRRFAPAALSTYAFCTVGLLLLGGTSLAALYQQQDAYTAWNYVNRGGEAYDEGKYAQAMTFYRQAAELAPDMAEAHCGLAMSALNLGDVERARLDATTAVRLQPDYALALGTLARAKVDLGDAQSALADIDRACQLEAENAWLHTVRAECEHALGNYERALTASQEAKRLNPSDPYTRLWRCGLLVSCPDVTYRDPSAAVAELTESGFSMPDALEYHYALAQAYVASGNFPGAKASLLAAQRTDRGAENESVAYALDHNADIGPTLVALRESWDTPWIDDLILHTPRRHLFVIVPESERERLGQLPLELARYSSWTHDVLTQAEYDQRAAVARNELQQLKIEPHVAASIVAYSAHSPAQLAEADLVELIDALQITRSEAQSLLQIAEQAMEEK